VSLPQLDAAHAAAVRDDHSRPGEALKNLGKEWLGTLRRLSQFAVAGPRPRWQSGHMNHHSNAVIGGSRKLHMNISGLNIPWSLHTKRQILNTELSGP